MADAPDGPRGPRHPDIKAAPYARDLPHQPKRDPRDESHLCGCDRPDLAEDPHRHDRDPACTFWAGIRDEVRDLAAKADGPDQGDPAAWGVEYLSNGEVHGRRTRRDAERSPCVLSGIARVVPLYLRAPGAVAAAPPGDDYESDYGLLRDHIIATLDVRDGEDAEVALLMDAVTRAGRLARLLVRDRVALARVKTQRDASDRSVMNLAAPPAGHEDEAAVERAERPGLAHFVPWGSTAAPCGWQCPRGDRDALPLTDRRRQTTCGACQERMTNWSPGERPPPVWPETAAARGPRTPDPGAGA